MWEDNGNLIADSVCDSVVLNLSNITGKSTEEIEKKVDSLVDATQ